MKFDRSSGILLHPTSLPGSFGIGDLGPSAHNWLEWLAGSGSKLWQVLPLGPTGFGDSPYQCFSAFAGNPYLISPELLMQEGLLSASEMDIETSSDPNFVDFGSVIPQKMKWLNLAFNRFDSNPAGKLNCEFLDFCSHNTSWLEDYATFMAIKENLGGGSWMNWPMDIRSRDEESLKAIKIKLISEITCQKFIQFCFFRQWAGLLEHAHALGIKIIGDIPIFVAGDSADVWSNPELFQLNGEFQPIVVAGVPPDYFSSTGQLWGNPLYRWEVHQQSQFRWWLDRIKATLQLVDFVRVDHFRGFAGYWEIPSGSPTAETGRWVKGPGEDLFSAIQAEFGTGIPIIAEDLGVITPDVASLRDKFGLPGMKVLQFGFSGPDNPFLPHEYIQNCVVYTGTHDNDTSEGWYSAALKEEKDFALLYLNTDGTDFAWDLIRAAWGSVAFFALAPLQDFLSLGTNARMNFPSSAGGNWKWRTTMGDLSVELQKKIKQLNWIYRR